MVKATASNVKPFRRAGRPAVKKKLDGTDEAIIRVNFDISRDDHTKLKIYAAQNGCSMAELLRAFVSSIKLKEIKLK
jgi:hypothetical protein